MPKVIVADNVYLPRDGLDMDRLKRYYECHVYKEKLCAKCSNKPERFNDICATCPAHLGFYPTWKRQTIKGKKYIGIPKGDKRLIRKATGFNIDADTFIDMRSDVRMISKLKFTAKLYRGTEVINGAKMANQRGAVKKFWKYKYGLLKSKPRTGKTVMATRLICAFHRRTLFIAHEMELLKQALRTFRKFTNIKKLERKMGRKLIGIIEKDSDWDENWDIVLCTYQKFITEKGKERVKKYIHRKFGLTVVDEVHRANANAYSEFVNFLDTRYAFGLTATDERKDGLEFLVEHILGPTVVETEAEGLVPTVRLHYTGLTPKYEWKGPQAYTHACTWLADHKKRNVELVRQIFRDLRANERNCIVVPVMRVKHAKLLVKMINRQAAFNDENKGEKWGDKLAIAYIGASDKDKVMKAAREGKKTRVTIAIRSKVQEGVDVIPWNILYLQFPMNNETNFYQMTQRICTAAEDKPEPILRIFVDGFGLSIGCFTATWFSSIRKLKYIVPLEELEKSKTIMENRSRSFGQNNIRARW